jgi:hypothetical protein
MEEENKPALPSQWGSGSERRAEFVSDGGVA